MPVTKSGSKYRIGKGPAVYKSKAKAERAQRAMYAAKKGKKSK